MGYTTLKMLCRYSLNSSAEDVQSNEPLLGHVSLLTAIALTKDGKRIFSADRDEHLRLSNWPNGWDIISYLGGHRR